MTQGVYLASHGIVRDGCNTLFLRRRNTGYGDGLFGFPSGKLEEGESFVDALVRELFEELGIHADRESVSLEYTMQGLGPDRVVVHCFFAVTLWSGIPQNNEPNKAEEVRWIATESEPPAHFVPFVAQAIRDMEQGRRYGEYGF